MTKLIRNMKWGGLPLFALALAPGAQARVDAPQNTATKQTTPIPFPTKYIEDENLKEGVREVVQKGQEGLREEGTNPGSKTLAQDPSSTAVKEGEFYRQTITINNQTATVSELKPLDLFLIIDGSGSILDTRKGGDNRKISELALLDSKKLVQSLPEGSRVMITSYLENKPNTYRTNRYSKLMSKAEAISMLNDFTRMSPQGKDWYTPFENYARNNLDKFLSVTDREFEDAYREQTNKNDLVSVVQFTDSWISGETIDTSFAAWAKSNAKTFMSVVYPNKDNTQGSGSDTQSILEMRKAGHPNIYNTSNLGDAERSNNIIEAFRNTAVEKQVGGRGRITFSKDGGATISDVELVEPNGTRTSGESEVTRVTNFDQNGNYKLSYKIKPNQTQTSGVTGTFTTSTGTQSKTDRFVFNTTPGESYSKIVREPKEEIIRVGIGGEVTETEVEPIDFETKYVEDDNLLVGQEVVQTEGKQGVRTIKKTWKTVKGVKKGEPRVDNQITTPKIDKVVRQGTAGEVTDSRKEPIPFATEIIEDENLPEGTEKVTVEGVTGEREFLTTYKTVKGQKVGNPIRTSFHITKEVVTKIIHKGVKGSKTEVENVEIPYTTKIVEDENLPLGTRKTVQQGQKGTRTITRTWVTHRKLKVGDPEVSEKVSKQPVEEIIHVGLSENVRDEKYEPIQNNKVGTDVKSVNGQFGQKLKVDWYKIAKGKRISDVKNSSHLLRMPINEVKGEKKPTITNNVSVRRFSLPPKIVSSPAFETPKYKTDITSRALSVLRKYKF